MVPNCQRDPFKVLWTVALLLYFAEILSAQNRLGLHFTQEELNIWRQRMNGDRSNERVLELEHVEK